MTVAVTSADRWFTWTRDFDNGTRVADSLRTRTQVQGTLHAQALAAACHPVLDARGTGKVRASTNMPFGSTASLTNWKHSVCAQSPVYGLDRSTNEQAVDDFVGTLDFRHESRAEELNDICRLYISIQICPQTVDTAVTQTRVGQWPSAYCPASWVRQLLLWESLQLIMLPSRRHVAHTHTMSAAGRRRWQIVVYTSTCLQITWLASCDSGGDKRPPAALASKMPNIAKGG